MSLLPSVVEGTNPKDKDHNDVNIEHIRDLNLRTFFGAVGVLDKLCFIREAVVNP